jgi:tetratricopeptide repeat protein 21B
VVNLGAITALLNAHKKCQNIDKEAVAQLDAALKEERKKASDEVNYYSKLFIFT